MKKLTKSLALLCFVLVALTKPLMAGELRLSVAASLKEVMNEITAKYSAKHPSTTFVKNFGGSGTLAGQIEQGAPVDLFIAANTEWMDHVKDKKLVDATTIKNFAYNELVFAGSTNKKVTSMNDLLSLDKIAIGSPKSVPAGEYAMTAFTNSGIAEKIASKLVMAKDVRECLMYAEIGEVDGAFVYRTDAMLAQKAKLRLVVPQKLYPRVVYPMALTMQASKNREAQAFISYLNSNEAKSVLRKYSFLLK
uniref:Molybdenum ABC transporter, periplasmic binding protein n=1 Tax=Chlorobium chlorochromatii (strain CaD3) TaxID=340177 RepID=Q3ATI9_CHLCH